MKNKLITLAIMIVLGVGAFFIGRSYYYNNIYNYTRIINDSLENFYVSWQTSDLDPISVVLDKYKENDSKLLDVQNKIYNNLDGWIDYLDGKYICDGANVNSCRLYYNELINMDTNIKKIFAYRDGMLSQDKYQLISDNIEVRIEEVKEIIDDPASVRSKNYEEIRLGKCEKALECSECRAAMCECTYVNGENKKESIICKNKQQESNK